MHAEPIFETTSTLSRVHTAARNSSKQKSPHSHLSARPPVASPTRVQTLPLSDAASALPSGRSMGYTLSPPAHVSAPCREFYTQQCHLSCAIPRLGYCRRTKPSPPPLEGQESVPLLRPRTLTSGRRGSLQPFLHNAGPLLAANLSPGQRHVRNESRTSINTPMNATFVASSPNPPCKETKRRYSLTVAKHPRIFWALVPEGRRVVNSQKPVSRCARRSCTD